MEIPWKISNMQFLVSVKKTFCTERKVQRKYANVYNLGINVNGKPISLISYTSRSYLQCLDNKREYGKCF